MKSAVFCFAVLMFILPFVVFGQTKEPRSLREFFNLLPPKYFTLEGCEPKTDKNCERARRAYVENFLEIEDATNGYWKSGCDGAQSCLTMTLFKRPNGTYLVALKTEFEMGADNYFLEYKNGRWFDISRQIVPDFSKSHIYELPRRGTTVAVYAKTNLDEVPERGNKLYDLTWKNGKFSIKK